LEKTSKITKSNHQPNTTMPAKPCPEVQYLRAFWTSPGTVTPPLPWAAYSNVAAMNGSKNLRPLSPSLSHKSTKQTGKMQQDNPRSPGDWGGARPMDCA